MCQFVLMAQMLPISRKSPIKTHNKEPFFQTLKYKSSTKVHAKFSPWFFPLELSSKEKGTDLVPPF